MLTRSQVARRIGRSIATVRKMEGRTLHPRVDARGVHRFDAVEVEAAARRIAKTGRALDANFPQATAKRHTTRTLSTLARVRDAHTMRKVQALEADDREVLAALAEILQL